MQGLSNNIFFNLIYLCLAHILIDENNKIK